jgi:hypothetical protein
MALSICPGCKQNADRDAGFCALCGFDFSSDRVEHYNRKIMWWVRVSAVVCAAVIILAIRSMGRRTGYADYRDLVLIEMISAGIIYGALKLVFRQSRRNLWLTALIPSFFIVTGVFVCRACLKPDASLSLNTLMGASPARASIVAPTASVVPTAAAATARSATPQAAKDDFAALVPIASDCFKFMRRQPEFIVSEVKGAGVDKMLLPGSLENAKQLDASHARLKKLGERLAAYETRIRKSAADLKDKINASAASDKTKANFLAEVRRSGGEFVRNVLEFAVVERKSVAASDDLVAFLRARSDKFTVINKRPMFADGADSKKYDALRKAIDDLNARADQLLPNVRTQGERAIRELNSPSDADGSRATAAAGS